MTVTRFVYSDFARRRRESVFITLFRFADVFLARY